MVALMSNERLIRLPQVQSLTGLKRAHLYALARRGEFPKPIKIGLRASAWQESMVLDWLQEKIRSAP